MTTTQKPQDEATAHRWFVDGQLKLECCKICGIVRRADDQNRPCRGPVHVVLRDKKAAQDEATALREYGLRIADAVQTALWFRLDADETGLTAVQLAAIVASVELPEQEILDAPTCEGWWWARERESSEWIALFAWQTFGPDPAWVIEIDGVVVDDFDAWSGPLTPPSAPSPADAQQSCPLVGCKLAMPHVHTTSGPYTEKP